MTTEQIVSLAHGPAPPVPTTDSSGSSSDLSNIKNLMLILAMLNKGTMDSNAESQKFFGRREKDGNWIIDLVKGLEKGVDPSSSTPYKDTEKLIDEYLEKHKNTHFDSTQILALYALKCTSEKMKPLDEEIEKLVPQVASDYSDYQSAMKQVQHDKDEISRLEHDIKHPGWDFWKVPGWAAELANYERKLYVFDGFFGKSDMARLSDAAKKYQADSELLTAKETQEGIIFSKGVLSQKDQGEAMSSSAKYKVQALINENKQIMSLASTLFTPIQA